MGELDRVAAARATRGRRQRVPMRRARDDAAAARAGSEWEPCGATQVQGEHGDAHTRRPYGLGRPVESEGARRRRYQTPGMNESNVKGRRSHHHMAAPPPTRGPLLEAVRRVCLW